MIDVRKHSTTVEVRGVRLVATTTTIAVQTQWVTGVASYRRPSRVVHRNGTSVAVRDHSMILRCAAVLGAALAMKGMSR